MSHAELRSLVDFLSQHVEAMARDLDGQIRADAGLRRRAQDQREAEDAADEFESEWIPRLARRAAVAVALRCLFLRVLEDRGLLPLRRLGGTDVDEPFARAFPMLGARDYLRSALREGWRLLPDLFDDSGDFGFPANDVCRSFLDAWRAPDPDRAGRLLFDFRQGQEGLPAEVDLDAVGAPAGFDTRFLGDVYEQLDRETVKRYALCQTPSFIAEFILSETLVPAFAERELEEITLIDPTCGSGHFLLDAFWHFARRYLAHPKLGRLSRLDICKRIVQDHLFGADIVELSCELARFRLLLAGIDFVGRDALETASDDGHPLTPLQGLQFNIVCCDSLVPHERLIGAAHDAPLPGSEGAAEAAAREAAVARVVGRRGEQEAAWRIFHNQHTVCVGNPPYVTCDNPRKRDFYRTGVVKDADGREQRRVPGFRGYDAAYKEFQLGAPFTERFFQVVAEGGWVGLINSNGFAKRSFGKALVERVLPRCDLHLIADCGGVFIPGHGTPTVILCGRRRPAPADTPVKVYSCLKGEPSTPAEPEQGLVWLAMLAARNAGRDGQDAENEYVSLQHRGRRLIGEHPWTFGGLSTIVLEKIRERCPGRVAQRTDSIGRACATGADEVFITGATDLRIARLPNHLLLPMVLGEPVRDWAFAGGEIAVVPYVGSAPVALCDSPALGRYLVQVRGKLGARADFGQLLYWQSRDAWYEYHQYMPAKLRTPLFLTFAFVATHNHFVALQGEYLFKQSAPIIKLPDDVPFRDYIRLAGLLNSSTACFLLKQVCFDKGTTSDKVILQPDPVKYRYEFDANSVGVTPLPPLDSPWVARLTELAEETRQLGESLVAHHPRHLLAGVNSPYHGWAEGLRGYRPPSDDLFGWRSASDLYSARSLALEQCHAIRRRMVWLQEEMDWLAYGAYGLVDEAAMAELVQPVGAALVAARPGPAEGSPRPGLEDAPPDPDGRPQGPPLHIDPAHRPFRLKDNPAAVAALPAALQPVWQARLAEIARNEAVALIEGPVYKRRWVEPEWEAEFKQALVDWILDQVEWLLEHWPGFSVVTGLPPGAEYVPFDEAEIGPAERKRLQDWNAEPVHLSQLAARFQQDPRAMAVMAVHAGSDQFDTQALLAELMEKASVPASDELLFKELGLRKKQAWGTPWKLTDEEAAQQDKPPEFASSDHRSGHTWSLRGKLNVPRERFICYLEYQRGWYGWAGWDPRQRAAALVWLLARAQREGLDQATRLRLMVPLHRILEEGQLVPTDDPQPSVSPLPPCEVSPEEWQDLVHIVGDSSLAGWPLGGECPYELAGVWEVRTSPRTAQARRAEEPAAKGDASADLETIEAAVLEALGRQGKLSQAQLLGELAQVDEKRLKKALKRLRDTEQIVLEGKGRSAGYRLPEAQMELDIDE